MSALPENWDRNNQGNPKRTITWDGVLTLDETIYLTAVHEAAHVVVGWRYGMRARTVWSREVPAALGRSWTGCVIWEAATGVSNMGYAAMCAAGERAAARYVRELGLWEPEMIHLVQADHDRISAVEANAAGGFHIALEGPVAPGMPGARWTEVIEWTDVDIDEMWPQITLVTGALITREELTGAQVAELLNALPSELSERCGTEATA